jgi:hypothetical protein
MSIKVKTIFNSANQKITVVNVDGAEYSSHSIKNPDALVKILELSRSLTPYERRDILTDLLGMMW